jgi:hypothetical protein
MINPICLTRMLWRSYWAGVLVSGCDFETSKCKTPSNVHILECKTCGNKSMAWSFRSLEEYK